MKGFSKRRARSWPGIGALVVSICLPPAAALSGCGLIGRQAAPGGMAVNLAPTDLVELADLVAAAYGGAATPPGPTSDRFRDDNGGLSVVLRAGGRERGSNWVDAGGSVAEAIVRGTAAARDATPEADRAAIDTAELCLAHTYRKVDPARPEGLGNADRGIRGLELRHRERVARFPPTRMIASNLDFAGVIRQFIAEQGVEAEAFQAGVIEAATFECEQVLVFLEPNSSVARGPMAVRAVRMMRGNQIVEPEEVTRERVLELERTMSDWLIRQVHEDGRITYLYLPSRGEEAPGNNLIRQWMASAALARIAKRRGDPALVALAKRNVEYNLKHSYRDEGGLGLIGSNAKVKLGAVALAAQTIIEHPARVGFASHEAALVRTTEHLQQADGSFLTFYKPPGRNDGQNFYPGETLLLWATIYRQTADPTLLAKLMRSFRYYRGWHREQRNPAFIPWHTQAYYLLWEKTRDPELVEFIFEMNDWLLSMQEWENVRYPDERGRFFDPKRPELGPPHASSTGVYLDGLIDAYRLAAALGDEGRKAAYRRTIVRGLRSIMQQQFADAVDMFYVADKAPVRGAVRTNVYDNRIRVDNVQHCLVAVQKINDTFGVDDYAASDR